MINEELGQYVILWGILPAYCGADPVSDIGGFHSDYNYPTR
jgi:hypothetical protein